MAKSVRKQLLSSCALSRFHTPKGRSFPVELGLAIILTCIGCQSVDNATEFQESDDSATVSKVIDGDTIEVIIDDEAVRVRLLGIDAPESVHPQLPVQCFGPEASAALAELLPPGTVVDLRRDVQARDHYDRLLLYVYRADDGLFVNQWLVENGLADENHYKPNEANRSELVKAKSKARSTSTGLWGACEGPDQPIR